MIAHLEPDILECEIKWALESIIMNKASGGDGIPVELLQILKDDAVNMPANLENSAAATGLEKVSFHSNPKERQCEECSNYHTTALISHTSKVMLKIPQARLQQYMNLELPDVQAVFRKGRGIRDQIANIHWITGKAREFQKISTSALLTKPKPLTVWITINCGKNSERHGNTRPPDLSLEKSVCRSGSNS